MAEGGAFESKRLPVGSKKAGALTGLDFADVRDSDIRHLGGSTEAVRFCRRDGANDFVVVTAGDRGFKRAGIGGNDRFGRIREWHSPDIDICSERGWGKRYRETRC